jgi:hypothetical protein
MASGDATRIWFAEMLDELRSEWQSGMDWPDMIAFCQRMEIRRMEIMLQKGIRGPRVKCPDCGKVERQTKADISVRSALFAMRKNEIVSQEEFAELDRNWKKYARKHELNMYGKQAHNK